MTQPIVIQGPAASTSAYLVSSPQTYNNNGLNQGYGSGVRDDKRETSCNDPIFAVLLIICVIAVGAVAGIYGPDALTSIDDGGDNSSSTEGNDSIVVSDYQGYIVLTVAMICASFVGAAGVVALMMAIPQFLIKVSLIFVVVLSGVIAVASFLTGNMIGGIIGSIFFAISVCYATTFWSRIPFATINLVTGCTAVRKHLSVTVFAYFFTLLAGGWSLIWALAFFGVFDANYDCDANNVCTSPSYGILFGLFLAFFFGHQVIQNSIHVLIAGVVGTWWFEPDDARVGCWDSNVCNSFTRTVTTSFGSICFGSLLVAILQALKSFAESARKNYSSSLACIAECILTCLASILECFNKWAFIYVGLYGMSYMKAGKSVFELFKNRGWEAIIADNLVGNCLFLISLLVGLLMGVLGLAFEATTSVLEDAEGSSKYLAFILGLVVGFTITSVLMSTIASSVNAVIVLFAEAPADFQQNHPELSTKMRTIWNEVFPGSF